MPREGFEKNMSNAAAAGFIRIKNLKKGTEISGLYLGSYTDKKYNKLNHKIQLGAAITLPVQADKRSPVENKKFKAGEVVVLNSTGSLDKQIVEYPAGTDMDIVYQGTATLTSGQFKGEEFHQFEIYAAPGAAVAKSSNGSAASDSEDADDDTTGAVDFS